MTPEPADLAPLGRVHVIGIGGTRDPLESYREWRGRPAPIEPLLARRGLT